MRHLQLVAFVVYIPYFRVVVKWGVLLLKIYGKHDIDKDMDKDKKHEQLLKSLHDPEFRKAIIDEHIDVGIAFQIRAIRKQQKLTQKKLADLLGKYQSEISGWEDPGEGGYSLQTLKELAKAFDVGLLVRFVPFNTLIDWTIDLTEPMTSPTRFTEEH